MGQRYLKGVTKDNSTRERFKIINGKKKFLCDYRGNCEDIAYAEVYPSLGEAHSRKCLGWSYLCREHFELDQKRYKSPYCLVDKA